MLSAQMEGEIMTDTQRRRVEELREQGYGYKKIANETGISPSTVKSYCRKLDVMSGQSANASREGNTIRCKECGEPITQIKGRKKKIFCCDECRRTWWNSHPDQIKKKAVYTYICPQCGTSFTAYGNSHRKYCSHECYIKDRFGGDLV